MSQFSSVAQLCLTLCEPMHCITPGFPVHHQLPKFAQIHVHRIGDAIQPSLLCYPLLHLLSIFSSVGSFLMSQFFPSVGQSIGASTLASILYSGLMSSKIDWFDLLAVQGTLKNLLQHYSSKGSILWCLTFFMVQVSHSYMTTGKNIALVGWTFLNIVIPLLFNMQRHIKERHMTSV